MSARQDLAVREPQRLEPDQIKYIAGSNFVPEHYRGKLPEIMACIATGRELGLGDMESLRGIYVVKGRPSLSAELMCKLVRRRGHSIVGDVTAEKTVATGKRADNGDTMTVTWTLEMAQRAGLAGENWKKYPEAMLWARAVSQLCRMLFPDCLSGIVDAEPEELSAMQEEARIEDAADVPFVPVETFAAVDGDPGPEDEPEAGLFPIPEGAREYQR